MRILFYDIKDNIFLLRMYSHIIKGIKTKLAKDSIILETALEDSSIDILNYIPSHNKKNKIEQCLKTYFTLTMNGISLERIKNIYDLSDIQESDVYVAWYYYPKHMKFMKGINCKKVVMGQHFVELKCNGNFSELGIDYFVNQIDTSNNMFINHYFNLENVERVTMPYAFEKRFIKKKKFEERKAKAISIGSISNVNGITRYGVYLEYMDTACIQPMRRTIYDEGDNEYIDVYNTHLNKLGAHSSVIYNSTVRDYINLKIEEKKKQNQADYYKFDMVDKFNEYMMCICGEENVGLPGIGFVECMACGCAYIGIDHEMYKGLGLIPNKHYISYDGTYNDLLNKIQYYQKHLDELRYIAENGELFVLNHFNRQTVGKEFLDKLKSLDKKG